MKIAFLKYSNIKFKFFQSMIHRPAYKIYEGISIFKLTFWNKILLIYAIYIKGNLNMNKR